MIPGELSDYILEQKEQFQNTLTTIGMHIWQEFPELEFKLAYGLPFYYQRKRVLYLVVIARKFVRLGFCYGAKLIQRGGVFSGSSKEVSYLDYHPGDQIDLEEISRNILLAIELDSEL